MEIRLVYILLPVLYLRFIGSNSRYRQIPDADDAVTGLLTPTCTLTPIVLMLTYENIFATDET